MALVRQSLWHWLLYCATTVFLLGLLQVLCAGPTKPLAEHWQAISKTVLTILLTLAVLLPKFVYDWLKASHRFAGPVEKLRRALRDLAEGKEYAELRFREDDFWRQLADELNSAVRSLHQNDCRDTTSIATEDEDAEWKRGKVPVSAN
jgi:hypothetical protein